MKIDEARNWLKRLQEQYPSVGVTDVRIHRNGFRVVYEGGELSLQKFQRKFADGRIPPAKR